MTRRFPITGPQLAWLALLACGWNPCGAAELVELTEKRQVRLASPVSNLCVGGGGRYLVLQLADQNVLSVFDLQEEETAFTVRPVEERILFAANREWLIVVHIESRLLQRWSLTTGKRLSETLFPIDGAIKAIAMGAASNGPLMVLHAEGVQPLDDAHYSLVHPQTLQVKRIEQSMRDNKFRDNVHVRVSGSGKLFGFWATSHTPSGLNSVWIRGAKITTHALHDSAGHVAPGGNGQFIYTHDGVYTGDLQSAPLAGVTARTFCVPAVTGAWFVTAKDGILSIRGGDTLIAFVSDSDYFDRKKSEAWIRSDMTKDKRIILAPEVAKLAILPDNSPIIEIFDFAPGMAAANAVLRVLSEPPIKAKKGTRLEYRVETTIASDLKFNLVGPEGMQVSPRGVLTWQVPTSYGKSLARVMLNITAPAGDSVRHGFVLRVTSD